MWSSRLQLQGGRSRTLLDEVVDDAGVLAVLAAVGVVDGRQVGGASFAEALAVRGEEAAASRSAVEAWLRRVGLLGG